VNAVIEIAAIRPPKEGKKLATVVAAGGQSFGMWPDKAADLKIGVPYTVEVEESEFRGRAYRKIVKAKPVAANGNAGPAPIAPATACAEVTFVTSVLGAFIAAGKVGLDARDMERAVPLIRALWRVTFGGAGHDR
jgi:hypothetical protein